MMNEIKSTDELKKMNADDLWTYYQEVDQYKSMVFGRMRIAEYEEKAEKDLKEKGDA